MSDRLLSLDDVARMFGIRKDSVGVLIEKHGLPGAEVGGQWKVGMGELGEWLGRGGRQAVDDLRGD